MVLGRTEAEDETNAAVVRSSRFVYIGGGSPMHLRSVLKGSRLWEALLEAWRDGAVLAASSAGAMVLCDPMVDPRGGAYTVGLGLLANMPIFPHHDTAPAHLLERSMELRPDGAVLVGVDEQTALLRDPDGGWRVAGQGSVTLYGPGHDDVAIYGPDATVEGLPPGLALGDGDAEDVERPGRLAVRVGRVLGERLQLLGDLEAAGHHAEAGVLVRQRRAFVARSR